MSASWDWPGSRWWRVDLHTRSPASHDFGTQVDRDHPDWVGWITAARDAGLNAVAITDHNTAGGIERLQQAASEVQDSPLLFPDVEVTASDGVHLLVVMDPSRTERAAARVPGAPAGASRSRGRGPADERHYNPADLPQGWGSISTLGIATDLFPRSPNATAMLSAGLWSEAGMRFRRAIGGSCPAKNATDDRR